VEHAVAVLDPGQHAASYVALSRDRDSTTVVLAAEAVAGTPAELAELLGLPAGRRDAQVRQRYADALHAAGVDERSRGLLVQRWPEFATQPDPDRGTRTAPLGELEQARQTVAALARHADRATAGPCRSRASRPRRTASTRRRRAARSAFCGAGADPRPAGRTRRLPAGAGAGAEQARAREAAREEPDLDR